ncbi:MAG TPA: FAD-dependent thymidylate synthase [Acidimicrobiia bacterium]
MEHFQESFTDAERAVLSRFFTNTDGPVFALVNLPEVVKGALFARYSRSAKSVRRLFLDEFVANPETGIEAMASALDGGDKQLDLKRAEDLYRRVFFEYGDDSVAQLGGVHLACEQASNILTKVLEWGRLAAYLEQSTRYVPYDGRLGGSFRYRVPPEIEGTDLAARFAGTADRLFATYADMAGQMRSIYEDRFPRQEGDSVGVWNATIKAKAFDAVRGLLPAATISNVGMYATGQAYEMALVRMRSNPLLEVREYSDLMLTELRKVIPSFLTRVDLEGRGVAWSDYLADVRDRLSIEAESIPSSRTAGREVTLTEWDPETEVKLAAAALYAVSEASDQDLLERARRMTETELATVINAAMGARTNRRHKPGRSAERSSYRFDVVCDFGAFRDLQRHRMMTIEWQPLTTRLGFDLPEDVAAAGLGERWEAAMEEADRLYEDLRETVGVDVAQYAVPLAFNIRFVMQLNLRQAFHLLELRTQPAGHPAYRWVCQEMHRQIAEVAGHRLLAAAMTFVDESVVDLERLESERKAEARRLASA